MPKLSAKDRPRHPASAANAKPQTVVLRNGGQARNTIMQARLDRRSRAGKAYLAELEALVAHLGGAAEVTHPQRVLAEQAARLMILESIAWAELSKADDLSSGATVDTFFKAARDRRAVLAMLGLTRASRDMGTLDLAAEIQRQEAGSAV